MEQSVISPKRKQFPTKINMPTKLSFTVNGQIGYFLSMTTLINSRPQIQHVKNSQARDGLYLAVSQSSMPLYLGFFKVAH